MPVLWRPRCLSRGRNTKASMTIWLSESRWTMIRGVIAGLSGITHPTRRPPTSSSILKSILGSDSQKSAAGDPEKSATFRDHALSRISRHQFVVLDGRDQQQRNAPNDDRAYRDECDHSNTFGIFSLVWFGGFDEGRQVQMLARFFEPGTFVTRL